MRRRRRGGASRSSRAARGRMNPPSADRRPRRCPPRRSTRRRADSTRREGRRETTRSRRCAARGAEATEKRRRARESAECREDARGGARGCASAASTRFDEPSSQVPAPRRVSSCPVICTCPCPQHNFRVRSTLQTYFTHRSVSTLDRISFQLTDENCFSARRERRDDPHQTLRLEKTLRLPTSPIARRRVEPRERRRR